MENVYITFTRLEYNNIYLFFCLFLLCFIFVFLFPIPGTALLKPLTLPVMGCVLLVTKRPAEHAGAYANEATEDAAP